MRSYQALVACLFTASTSLALKYADNIRPLNKNPDFIDVHFPDVDDEIFSPAFLNPENVPDGFANGTSGPTSQDDLETFLKTLASRNSWLTYREPDFRSEEGRSLPYVYLTTTENFTGRSSGKLRFYITGGTHGNEPAGDEAALAFLGKLDNDPEWAAEVLEKIDFLIIPRYNPDGVAYLQRWLATNADPNRDHVKLARQFTRDVKTLQVPFDAHLSVIFHEYGAYQDGPYEYVQDNMFSPFKSLNIHPDIRNLQDGLFTNGIGAALDAKNLTHGPYVVASEDWSALYDFTLDSNGDDHVSLSQGVEFLSETRGIGIGDQHFRRRVSSGLTLITAMVQTAVDNFDEVYSTIEDARADYATSDEDIVVISTPRNETIEWPFYSSSNGSLLHPSIVFLNNTPGDITLSRLRPEAYVFSKAWADIADRLRSVGVEVETLQQEFEGEVEVFNITEAIVAPVKFEGAAQTSVTTDIIKKQVKIPAGAFWVSSRQTHAAHAFVRLEPEAPSSFATWNIIPVAEADEYPIFRVPRKS